MTRETKIGLLVGLAFVIVIGILISDHLSNTNEPAGAPLRTAADNLRSSLGQATSDDVAPPLQVPASITPRQPVITVDELNHHPSRPPVVFVNPPVTLQPNPPSNQNETTGPTPNTNPIDHLREVARKNGEDLIDPNAGGRAVHDNQPSAAARTYIAQTGDSLGAIARKMYGSGSKANRDAILAANPSMADNGDLIVAGRTYVIPAIGTSPVVQTTPHAPVSTADATVTYIVKSHDTLWSIATNEVGSTSAITAIKELNKDVLNGSDRVRPNMKLKLPAKTAVSANVR